MQRGSGLKVLRKFSDHFVKANNLVTQRWQGFGTITSADEECFGIAKHARHVTNKLSRSANPFGSAKIAEAIRSVAQSFLRAVGQCSEEMSKQFSFVIHD